MFFLYVQHSSQWGGSERQRSPPPIPIPMKKRIKEYFQISFLISRRSLINISYLLRFCTIAFPVDMFKNKARWIPSKKILVQLILCLYSLFLKTQPRLRFTDTSVRKSCPPWISFCSALVTKLHGNVAGKTKFQSQLFLMHLYVLWNRQDVLRKQGNEISQQNYNNIL